MTRVCRRKQKKKSTQGGALPVDGFRLNLRGEGIAFKCRDVRFIESHESLDLVALVRLLQLRYRYIWTLKRCHYYH